MLAYLGQLHQCAGLEGGEKQPYMTVGPFIIFLFAWSWVMCDRET